MITVHGVWSHVRTDFIKLHGRAYVVGRMLVDFILLLMWIGTATLMLRPRQVDYSVPIPPFPPDVPWAIGIAFTFVEMCAMRHPLVGLIADSFSSVFFILTIFLVFKEHRAGGKGGPSAAYV